MNQDTVHGTLVDWQAVDLDGAEALKKALRTLEVELMTLHRDVAELRTQVQALEAVAGLPYPYSRIRS